MSQVEGEGWWGANGHRTILPRERTQLWKFTWLRLVYEKKCYQSIVHFIGQWPGTCKHRAISSLDPVQLSSIKCKCIEIIVLACTPFLQSYIIHPTSTCWAWIVGLSQVLHHVSKIDLLSLDSRTLLKSYTILHHASMLDWLMFACGPNPTQCTQAW